MKRKIRLFTVLCLLAALLTGCRSSDYKKAQGLYEAGEYARARTMFAELEDYEDSRDMVTRCAYELAREAFENGSYENAREQFAQLGDYKDSPAMVKKCAYQLAKEYLRDGDFEQAEACLLELGDYEDAQQMLKELPGKRLLHYLRNVGELSATTQVSKDAAYVVTVRALTENAVEIVYDYKGKNSTVTSDIMVTMVLEPGQSKMQVQGTYHNQISFFGKTSNAEEAVEGELEIRTYQYGDEMLWDKHFFKGKNVNGEPLDEKVSGFFLTTSNAPLERTLTSVEVMLEEHQVGVTLQELGFVSLG